MTQEEQAAEQAQKDVIAGRRMQEFLEDPLIAGVLVDMDKRCVADFRDADTDDKRRAVWQRLDALRSLVEELRVVFDRGQFSAHAVQQSETPHGGTPAPEGLTGKV